MQILMPCALAANEKLLKIKWLAISGNNVRTFRPLGTFVSRALLTDWNMSNKMGSFGHFESFGFVISNSWIVSNWSWRFQCKGFKNTLQCQIKTTPFGCTERWDQLSKSQLRVEPLKASNPCPDHCVGRSLAGPCATWFAKVVESCWTKKYQDSVKCMLHTRTWCFHGSFTLEIKTLGRSDKKTRTVTL